MRPRLLIALLAVGCTDYNFTPEKETNKGNNDDTAVPDEDTDEPEDTSEPDTGDTGGGIVVPDPTECADFDTLDPIAVDLNTSCEVTYSTGTFTPVTEWVYGSSSFCGPPAAGVLVDSDGDGDLDDHDMPVILLYQYGAVHAVFGDGSGVAWTNSTRSYGQDSSFALGDVTGDGWPDVITSNSGMVCALDGNTGAEHWCNGGLYGYIDTTGYSYASISDLDGDGQPEVIVGATILDGLTGALRGQGTGGRGMAPYGGSGTWGYGSLTATVDLDGDGQVEVVAGNTAYDANGNTVWSNTGLDGLIAVADFDLDGQGEIVKTSGIYVTGMESNGTEVWGPIAYSGNLGAPAIDDLDGDGVPEIVFAAQNRLVAMEWGGSVLWETSITDSSGAAGPTLFDFEMDGYPEVLYADETTIRFFNGRDGTTKFTSTGHASYTILETPIVADVDNDDEVEIVLGHCSGSGSIGALTVYGDADHTWPPGRKWWNQHGYHITNIADDGLVDSPTPNNFALYNSYRSGDVGRPPNEYWDLRAEIVDVCEIECEADRLLVQARVLNAGNIEAPAGVYLSLRTEAGGTVVESQALPDVIGAGASSPTLVFDVSASSFRGLTPVVTADENTFGMGALYECDEDNNVGSWSAAVCAD